jgi:hypothetical protein
MNRECEHGAPRRDCYVCDMANELASLRAALSALRDLVYCADCWDNPEHRVCEKHLGPARAVLAAYDAARGKIP